MPLETIHILVAIGTLFTTTILAYISIKTKLDIANNNAKMMESQNAIKGTLDTHVATDDIKHEAFDKHFEATDSRVTRLEHGRGNRGN